MIIIECIKCGYPHELKNIEDFHNRWPWYCKECNFVLKIEGMIPKSARQN